MNLLAELSTSFNGQDTHGDSGCDLSNHAQESGAGGSFTVQKDTELVHGEIPGDVSFVCILLTGRGVAIAFPCLGNGFFRSFSSFK